VKNPRRPRTGACILLTSLATSVVAGCAVHPSPLTEADRKATLTLDQQAMFGNQQPVQGPITLEEAMARAVKYNLDSRVKLMEAAVAQRQLDLSNFDLLPKLVAGAGYSHRDQVLGSSSRSVLTGQQSLEPSTSTDKDVRTADLGLSWNILDFGVSYYGAKQQADRVLGLQERRRKAVQQLMQQTRTAFWQAVGAQRVQGQIEPLLTQARQALDDSRKVEQSNLKAPLEALSYQRELLELIYQLEGIRDQLLQAKPKLAAIMDLPPGQAFQLAAPEALNQPVVQIDPEKMEETALLNRPELIEASYNERIGLNETHKAVARLLPGVELSLGTHYDSNSFLVHNEWSDAGVRASWNLLNLVNAKNIRASAKAQYDLARQQRLAANVAVLAQVHVAWIDFNSRKEQFQLVNELNGVEQRMFEHTRNAAAADTQSKLTEIRAQTSALMTKLRLYQTYSAYQDAYGQVLTTLGIDPVPKASSDTDLAELTKAIGAQLGNP
jgi:outer membrane protein TolC